MGSILAGQPDIPDGISQNQVKQGQKRGRKPKLQKNVE